LEKEGRRLAKLERKGASSDKAEKDGGEK